MTTTELFIKLTEKLIPYKQEYLLEPYLPEDIQEDEVGNYYIIIGKTKTMFTCHLDNYTTELVNVKHVFFEDDKGRKKVKTDERTPLGSDDKAGATIMIKMIENKVPGCYYFFIGEEPAGAGGGCKGSNEIYEKKKDWFKRFNRCIAFDRKGYGSIISKQRGKECCSKDFVNSLSTKFSEHDLIFKDDPSGRYTDSAVFMYVIPEVTNLSCGGFNEHTTREFQNLDYLEKMVEACSKINWEDLPVVRAPKEPIFHGWDKPKETYWGKKKRTESEKEKNKNDERHFKEETPLSKKRTSEEQKGKPDFGFLNYKKLTSKSSKELYDQIVDYLDYFGYSVHFSTYKDRNYGTMVFTGGCNLSVNYKITDEKSDFIERLYKGDRNFIFSVRENDSVIYIKYRDENKTFYRTFYTLKDFEQFLGVGFAAKFYKYTDSFIKDLIQYSKEYGRWAIHREDVETILRQYGKFKYDDLLKNYDKLFDSDDFKMDDQFIRI